MVYTKDTIKELLFSHTIEHTWYNHIPVFGAEDSAKLDAEIEDWKHCAKNLFLRDEKAKNYYLVTVQKQKKVNLKELAPILGCRRLSFANSTELMTYLGVTPGSVSPFGTLHDKENAVKSYIDADFIQTDFIVCHPNLNDASVAMSTKVLLDLLAKYEKYFQMITIPV